ncbi:MAG TPA: LysR family transcriptional regulator [Candidatus Corynebacterium avicola]|uniref:LysR family transcriptional regulator n=1 Tax=Candidatus Corynebacterium avicola TaxID=2838527 RepID=A0A9D1RMC6_9CORY|nr:LysR family transcriptional regulator [Candidatus Corynebacterium avicola]
MNGRLTLEALRYTDAVADVGSFSAAARRFGVTQPALSTSIAKLEDHLGGRLFLRNPRGTAPTAFGDVILPRIHEVVRNLERIETEAESFSTQGRGTVRVGTSPQIEKAMLSTLRDSIYGPDAITGGRDATMLETELDQLEEYLQNGMLDMLIVPALGLLPAYSHRLLDSDYLVLVEPEGSDGSPISVVELAGRELILSRNGCGITRSVENLMAEAGETVTHSEVEVANCSTLVGWVNKGMGSVVLPERNVPDGLVVRRIERADGTHAEMFNEMIWDPASVDAPYFEQLSRVIESAHNPIN